MATMMRLGRHVKNAWRIACAYGVAPFNTDRESLYSLFVGHVGNEGVGSDIVNRYQQTKNGYACYHAFNAHFKNDSFLDNKATTATKAMNNALYKGDRQHFTLETNKFAGKS